MTEDNEEQVGELIDTFTILDSQEETRQIVQKDEDLKKSLTCFVVNFLNRVSNHKNIEDILKEALIEKLPEASFEEINNALSNIMTKTNSAVEKVMLPFSQKGDKNIDTVNNFLFEPGAKQQIEDKILQDEDMTQDTLKGLYDLAQMMNAITQNSKT